MSMCVHIWMYSNGVWCMNAFFTRLPPNKELVLKFEKKKTGKAECQSGAAGMSSITYMWSRRRKGSGCWRIGREAASGGSGAGRLTTSAAGEARTMSRGGKEVVTSGRSRDGRGVQLPATVESRQDVSKISIDGVAAGHGAHSPATK